ncbi:hypothetical protein KY338_00955 [Candidatus Woesearchaeota archaeon]|nr:hypothetical protein [Candidatus Woesearchaeota archaeon]MBW3006166.1 hypothetical protein [Candidatus Woesearchaeota archaeon]
MKLFKSKKGFDWAFLIVGVTILCLGFLYVQLDKKMDAFKTPIGHMQLDIISKNQQSKNLLFYADQSGRLAACDTIYELGKKGGFSGSSPCGSTAIMPAIGTLEPVAFSYWAKGKDKCYENVNFYKEFKNIFKDEFYLHLNRYNFVMGNFYFVQDNHEFMITDKKIVGSAVKNIEMEFVSAPTSGIGLGKYSFKPSFAVDFKTGLDDYFRIASAVDSLVSCKEPMQECINSLDTPGLKWSFQKIGLTTYVFSVEQDINCRFKGPKPKIMFAVEKPVSVPEVVTPPVPAPIVPPVPGA